MEVSELIHNHNQELTSLRGQVDLIVGGPPCQGFSSAGRRNPEDPRNTLTEEYLKIVELVEPRFLIIENVRGFRNVFRANHKGGIEQKPYSQVVEDKLTKLEYKVYSDILCCSDFGIPQNRKRFIMLAIKKDDPILSVLETENPITLLRNSAHEFRARKGLTEGIHISVKEAISDLETSKHALISHEGEPKGFKQIRYSEPLQLSPYQRLMREGMNGKPANSLRLARHTKPVVERFRQIQSFSSLGKCISRHDRKEIGIRKHSITPLHPHLPAATVTTLPDDILHYSEPRILTVRENARLQSFPDWFRFEGKYTTGGKERKNDCPRYTQVGNAVPPFLAEAIGSLLLDLISAAEREKGFSDLEEEYVRYMGPIREGSIHENQ